jgi:hypothetical protein
MMKSLAASEIKKRTKIEVGWHEGLIGPSLKAVAEAGLFLSFLSILCFFLLSSFNSNSIINMFYIVKLKFICTNKNSSMYARYNLFLHI